MRLLLLSVATMMAFMAAAIPESRAQSAYDYPICAIYQDKSGATACYYSSYEQCMATMSGIGGSCSPNPAYRGRASAGFTGAGIVTAPPHRKVRKVHRHHS